MKSRTDNRQRADLVEATAGPRGGGGGCLQQRRHTRAPHLDVAGQWQGQDGSESRRDWLSLSSGLTSAENSPGPA